MKSRAMNSTPTITAANTRAKITQLSATSSGFRCDDGAAVLGDSGALGVEPHREREQCRQTGADQQAGDDDLQDGCRS